MPWNSARRLRSRSSNTNWDCELTTNSTGTFSATTCTLASGTCSVTYTPTVVGHALITGTYAGDSVHTGSSGTFTLASTKRATTTTVTCSPASVLDNTPSTCTVTVADS